MFLLPRRVRFRYFNQSITKSGSFAAAQDFACGLPLRKSSGSRPQNVSNYPITKFSRMAHLSSLQRNNSYYASIKFEAEGLVPTIVSSQGRDLQGFILLGRKYRRIGL